MAQDTDNEGSTTPTAPTICREPNDLFTPAAKRVIGRLCRDFLDASVLTPTELLHAPDKQHLYLNRGTEYQAAVQKAAMAQAQAARQNVAQRVRELFNLVDAAVRHSAERLKAKPPADIDPAGFAAFVATTRKAEMTEAHDFFVNAALAQHLAPAKTWLEKIERLRLLADGSKDPATVLPIVDDLLAEILESKAALRELFGPSDNMGRFLEAVVDLLTSPQPAALDMPEAKKIRDLLGRHALPESRATLLRQLRRGIEAKTPLANGMPPADLNAHLSLLDALIKAGEAAGGENTIDQFGQRMARVLSVDTLAGAMRDMKRVDDKLIRALEIHRRLATSPGRLQVRQYVDFLFETERLVLTIGKEPEPIAQKLQRITKVHDALVTSGLSGVALSKHAEPLVALQSDLVRDNKLFERIEREKTTPAARALVLLDLCAGGAFIQGANLRAAHSEIKRHMQDESFAATLLAGADDKQTQAKRLSDLHQKLLRSGLAAATPVAGNA